MRTQFEAHGTWNISSEDRVLVIEGTGPWNLESLQQSVKLVEPFVQRLQGKPWAAMVILHGECIYVPAAGKKLTEILQNESAIGRVASALLVNDCFSPNFAKEHISHIYDKGRHPYAFFDDIDLARNWIEVQLNAKEYVAK